MVKDENLLTEIPSVQSTSYREIYCNQAKMAATPWDFRATFAHIKPTDKGPVGTDEVTIVMSPQHAKAFISHWQKTVENYERLYGPVIDPTSKVIELKTQALASEKTGDNKKAKSPKKTEQT